MALSHEQKLRLRMLHDLLAQYQACKIALHSTPTERELYEHKIKECKNMILELENHRER